MSRITYIPNRVIDSDGISDGASIYVYQTGTTTPVSLYLDADFTTPTTNPYVVGTGAAVPPLYHNYGGDVRMYVVSSNGDIYDEDPYGSFITEALDSAVDSATAAAAASATAAAGSATAAANSASDAADTAAAIQAELDGLNSNQELSQVLSGLGIAWTGSLNFTMSSGTYYISGTTYTAAEQSISLNAADGTNPRIDVLAVDTTGTLVKITGTPAANPSQPDINPETQLFLKFVLVPAGATAPTIDADEIVYEENDGVGEWTGAVLSGTSIAINSASEPDSGTVCIAATNAGNASAGTIRLDKGSTMSVDTIESISIRFKSKTASWGTGRVRIHFQNSSGARVGNILSLLQGSYGLTTSNITTYQTLVIPITEFAIPAGTNIQYLQIADISGAAISWRMDNIKIKKSSTATGSTSNGISQTQADARYAQRANNLSDLSSASTARENIGALAKALTITTQAGTTYTFVLSDAGTHVRFSSGSAVTLTVPANASVAFPTGTRIRCTAAGAGGVTISPAGGVTVNSRDGALASGGQYAVFELEKVGTNEWDALGDLA